MGVTSELAAPPRVRFAPSPTGYLHVGGARTALFNWLFARKHGGVFILRIEDTDVERSSEEMVEGILEGLRWLGLRWDEGPGVGGPYGPYFQSGRLERYREMAERLAAGGLAYYCYCTPEALRARREAAERQGGGWRYDRACLALSSEEIAERERAGRPRAIRFRVPAGRTVFRDLVHGEIAVDHETIEDFVILRSDGHPTYQLSVVVDDLDMRITHVIRGDDHISNTPKQILLYRAFGGEPPAFAHVPLILGPDRRRLSKRHGATSVMEYKRLGYLPEAMVNFLALLGWSPATGQEIFTRDELIAAFSLEGISSSQAIFNPEKLDWFNAQHIMRLDAAELARRLEPELRASGFWRDEYAGVLRGWLLEVIELLKPRVRRLPEFIEQGLPFFAESVPRDPAAVAKHLSAPELAPHLAALRERLAALEAFDPPALEAALRAVAAERGVPAPVLIHATRVAVTG
ncbi:MAG TPA: glutamate--tRNA ligase, partial [Vicinamibacterales bacterium]|nr:glutamate--tRNA ligase [Vicinamibacterales bacterium]